MSSSLSLHILVVSFDDAPEQILQCVKAYLEEFEQLLNKGFQPFLSLVLVNPNLGTRKRQQRTLEDGLEYSPAQLVVLHLPENPGYGAAMNLAASTRQADYLLFSNADLEWHSQALSEALDLCQSPETVAVLPADAGGKNLTKHYPSVLALLLRMAGWRRLREWANRHYELRSPVGTVEIPIASGCCLLTRASAFERVGGFDERYFLYFEDFDLSLKLSRLGRIRQAASARVAHQGGAASSKGVWHILKFARSGMRFFADHGWRILS